MALLVFTLIDFHATLCRSLWLCVLSSCVFYQFVSVFKIRMEVKKNKNKKNKHLATHMHVCCCCCVCVMSVAVRGRQFISDRQTKHGGFGGGRDARRGKVQAPPSAPSSVIALILSLSLQLISSKICRCLSQPPPLSAITPFNTMELISVIHSSLSRVYVHMGHLGLLCHKRLGSVVFLLVSLAPCVTHVEPVKDK